MNQLIRRYDFMCRGMTCYYKPSGKKHTCTDCAVAKAAEQRDTDQWDHAVFMLDIRLKKGVLR